MELDLERYQNIAILHARGSVGPKEALSLSQGIPAVFANERAQEIIVSIDAEAIEPPEMKVLINMRQTHANQFIKYKLVSPIIPGSEAPTVLEALNQIVTNESKKIREIYNLRIENENLEIRRSSITGKLKILINEFWQNEAGTKILDDEVERKIDGILIEKKKLEAVHQIFMKEVKAFLKLDLASIGKSEHEKIHALKLKTLELMERQKIRID